MTEDGKINMPYLKALIALQSQKYGISNWLNKTGMYKYAAEHNLAEGVSEALHTREIIKQMGYDSEQSFTICGFPLFANTHCPFHISTKSTIMKKPNKLSLLR